MIKQQSHNEGVIRRHIPVQ